MAPVYSSCFYKDNLFRSESELKRGREDLKLKLIENDSGSDSEGGESSASGSRSSSVDSARNQARRSSHGSERSRSPSPADSQASGSSVSQGRRSRRDSSGSPQKGGNRSGRSASGSPGEGSTGHHNDKSVSRSPSPDGRKSGSASPGRGSGGSGSETPVDDKSNASGKNSERSRSPSLEGDGSRKGRSRSVGSNNSRQSSPGSRSGSGESDSRTRHSKEGSESPAKKSRNHSSSAKQASESQKAGSKSPSARSHSGSENEGNLRKASRKGPASPEAHSGSEGEEKRKGPSSPQEMYESGSPQGRKSGSHESDSDDGGPRDGGRKRKRAVLSDDSGSDAERKKQDTGGAKDDGDESEKDLVIDAEALFGDASDISSDEEGKKRKGEKKTSENEAEPSHAEESDGGSGKGRSGDEENAMEVDEKEEEEEEEDKENMPEEPVPETRIDVQIPKISTDLGKEIHFVKLPNFLSVETRPFDPSTYEDEIDEEETLDEEGRARLKLKVENTIRWREVTKQNGEFEKQSNARFVKWSDGSLSLHLGSEIFDVCKQPLQGDHNHLFIRQGTGLQGQAVFRTKLTFRPHSTESFTHRKMTLSLADRSQKTARIKVLSLVGKDPEAHRGELIKKEEEKLRASVRRESKQRRIREKGASRGLSAGYLEPDRYGEGDSDDEGISINAIKKQHKNKFINAKDDRSHIYSSDEEGSDIETRRARRLDKAKALKDSDSEGSGGGGGGEDKSGDRSSSGED